MKFYLGTHMPHWLARSEVPLFVSHRRLSRRMSLPRAITSWALDSGGFTELSMFGEWRTSPIEYVAAVRRYKSEIGLLDWAAPQDAMCEPWILEKAKHWLGGTIEAHQRWTVRNFVILRSLASDISFIPVLQGISLDDYLRCVELYEVAGVNLESEATVGIGSVCRRQATSEIARLVAALASQGLRLHGFGVKGDGLRRYGWCLASADSMAWSYDGRRVNPCPHTGLTSCANCWTHAISWRSRALTYSNQPIQMELAI